MLCVVVCCCDLLEVVGWSLKLVKLQHQQMPTFLLFRGHQSVAQQWWVRLHSTSNKVAPAHAHYIPVSHDSNLAGMNQRVVCMELWVFVSQSPLYSHLKTQHVVTCCERLLTSRNKRQRCWPNNVACCCERLRGPLICWQPFFFFSKGHLDENLFIVDSILCPQKRNTWLGHNFRVKHDQESQGMQIMQWQVITIIKARYISEKLKLLLVLWGLNRTKL